MAQGPLPFPKQLAALHRKAKAAAPDQRTAILREAVALCAATDDTTEDEPELHAAFAALIAHLTAQGAFADARAAIEEQIAHLARRIDELAARKNIKRQFLNGLRDQLAECYVGLAALCDQLGEHDAAATAVRESFVRRIDRDERDEQLTGLLHQLETQRTTPAARYALVVSLAGEPWVSLHLVQRIGDLAYGRGDHAGALAAYQRVVGVPTHRLEQVPDLGRLVLRLAGLHAAAGADDAVRALHPIAVVAQRVSDFSDDADDDDLMRAGRAALTASGLTPVAAVADESDHESDDDESDHESDDDDALQRAYELVSDLERELDDEEAPDADVGASAARHGDDLVLAAYFGDVTRAQAALDAGASPDATQRGTGQSALLLAVGRGHLAIVRLLLERGADAATSASVTVRGTTTQVSALDRAVGEGRTEIAELLRAHGGDHDARTAATATIAAPSDWFGRDDLTNAIADGDAERAVRCLQGGADPKGTTLYGEPFLVYAIRARATAVAAALLDFGADPNIAHEGAPVLHDAIRNGDPEMVRHLLAAGAVLRDGDRKHRLGSALMSLSEPGDAAHRALIELLLQHGLPPDTIVGDEPLLWHALRDRDERLAQIVLAAGADVHWRSKHGQLGFELLDFDQPRRGEGDRNQTSRGLLRLLLAHGLDPDREGILGPPSYRVVSAGDVEALRALLAAGASPEAEIMGLSLRERARLVRDPVARAAITELLEYFGARRNARACLLWAMRLRAIDPLTA